MISGRPHYLPREFSSVFFVAVYIPPQSEAGTKTALKELYSAINLIKSNQNVFVTCAEYNR